jgi:hypothetical protein
MSTIMQGVELFNIFAETYGKEKAQVIVKDIEEIIDSRKQDLATKGYLLAVKTELKEDIKQVELKIEQAKSSTIKWVAGLLAAQAGAIIAAIVAIIFAFLK